MKEFGFMCVVIVDATNASLKLLSPLSLTGRLRKSGPSSCFSSLLGVCLTVAAIGDPLGLRFSVVGTAHERPGLHNCET
jgi:hypothetical protein